MSVNGAPLLGVAPSHISVSNSEQKTFKSCRRRWWLEYYRGLSPRSQRTHGPLVLGTRVHAALERHYMERVDLVEAYMELVAADRLLLVANDPYLATDTMRKFDAEAELGRIMMEGYAEWVTETNADALYEFLVAEQKIEASVLDGKVSLIGKVDAQALLRYDGSRVFWDWKTAQSMSDYDHTAHMDEQLMMYMLIELLSGAQGRSDGAVFRILKKVKRSKTATPPFYRDLEVRFNSATINSFHIRILGVIRDMLALREKLDAGEDHRAVAYPTPTKDCHWKCPFYKVCTSFDDGSAVEEMLSEQYVVSDPYKRYEQEGVPLNV